MQEVAGAGGDVPDEEKEAMEKEGGGLPWVMYIIIWYQLSFVALLAFICSH